MKQTMTLLTLMLLVMAPALLPAATTMDGWQAPLTQLFSVVLMVFGVPLLVKLGKKLGITIDEQLASDAINALINILVNIDLGHQGTDPKVKKEMAVKTAAATLTNAQRDVLTKKYGSLEAAVQVAYERSSLNRKAK